MSDEIDETTALLRQDEENRSISPEPESGEGLKTESGKSVAGILSVLLIVWLTKIGVFISQADVFLVLTTYSQISSEFHALKDGGWLLTAYLLAQSVAQPLYGKLSDIFGRKRCLQMSYVFFALGTLCSSLAQSMPQIIASRALEGCGGAGMVCMVSILLTDLVPLHKVAVYRSYVNLVQTVGRSCGAVIGGYIAHGIGWRWGFFIQFPIVLIGLVATELKLHLQTDIQRQAESSSSIRQKLKRIDFVGAFFLSFTILSGLIFFHLIRQEYELRDPIVLVSIGVSLVSSTAFALVEQFYATEPIFPLRLLSHTAVLSAYTTLSMQTIAIISMTFVAPLYFQVVDGVNPAEAGFYLLPGPIGNTVGGLFAGWWIGKTFRYKLPLVIGAVCSTAAFVCLMLLWRGHNSLLDAALILPVGFATGIAHSGSFIGLTAQIDTEDIAIAGSGLYLFSNIGMMAGISIGNTVYQMSLGPGLQAALKDVPDKKEVRTVETVDNTK
ncbi:hypothetical protein Golomagni_06353 [Golovinomyces magnicellulatus]|nr:hypothetical protein Golomagni_06353 [Golovinomyces magnicellulatus]